MVDFGLFKYNKIILTGWGWGWGCGWFCGIWGFCIGWELGIDGWFVLNDSFFIDCDGVELLVL